MKRVLEAGKLVLASLRARLLGDVVTTEGTHECMYLEWVRVILAGHDFPPDVLFLRAVRSCAYACLSFEEASVLLCTRRLAMWVRLRQFQCGGPGQEAVAAFAAFGAKAASLQDVVRYAHGLHPRKTFAVVLRIGAGLKEAGRHDLLRQLYLSAAQAPGVVSGWHPQGA